jgi:hypothetical protein
MKGFPNYLVALALMALACSIASAYDPAPLQDFCVAASSSTDAGIYIYTHSCYYYYVLFKSFEASDCVFFSTHINVIINHYNVMSCDINKLFFVQYL